MKEMSLKTTKQRSALMSRVRQSSTKPELEVRKLMHEMGIRFRTKAHDLPGSPDIINRSKKWAIFVHGCFWHAHRGCYRFSIPKSNREFWKKKFEDNSKRDKKKIKEIENLGYSVLIIWQCELDNLDKLKDKILQFMDNI